MCFNHLRSSDIGLLQQGEGMLIGAHFPSSHCLSLHLCHSYLPEYCTLAVAVDSCGWHIHCHDRSGGSDQLLVACSAPPYEVLFLPILHYDTYPSPTRQFCENRRQVLLKDRAILPVFQ